MDRTLSQQEIDALLTAANRSASAGKQHNSVEPWRVERSRQVGAEQTGVVNGVHETLAKGIAQSFGAYLRISFETAFLSVQQITFHEFVQQLASGTYLLSIQFHGAPAAIEIDQPLVFPLIDVLLGGTGQGPAVTRDITEIEEHIMEGIGKIVCHEIATAWSVDTSECDLIGALNPVQAQSLMAAHDRVFVAEIDSKMGEAAGKIRAAVPAATFNALLRKLSSQSGHNKPFKSLPSQPQLQEKLMECTYPVTLGLTSIHVPLDRLLKLRADEVCNLGVTVDRPASLIIAGKNAFEAIPVRQGRKRAAQVGLERLHSEQKRTGQ
ncbi:MAG: FliM/FliN family flagellar motor switch protein [Terriglobales bacterium]